MPPGWVEAPLRRHRRPGARPAGEIDAAAVVDFAHPHGHLVAHLHHVFDLLDARFGELRDVDHAFLARKDLHEGADRDDPGDRTGEHLTLVHLAGQAFDDLLGFFSRSTIVGSDGHDAAVLDVDLGVGALGDALDRASTGANHGADQLGINPEAEQTWA